MSSVPTVGSVWTALHLAPLVWPPVHISRRVCDSRARLTLTVLGPPVLLAVRLHPEPVYPAVYPVFVSELGLVCGACAHWFTEGSWGRIL